MAHLVGRFNRGNKYQISGSIAQNAFSTLQLPDFDITYVHSFSKEDIGDCIRFVPCEETPFYNIKVEDVERARRLQDDLNVLLKSQDVQPLDVLTRSGDEVWVDAHKVKTFVANFICKQFGLDPKLGASAAASTHSVDDKFVATIKKKLETASKAASGWG